MIFLACKNSDEREFSVKIGVRGSDNYSLFLFLSIILSKNLLKNNKLGLIILDENMIIIF